MFFLKTNKIYEYQLIINVYNFFFINFAYFMKLKLFYATQLLI